MNNNWVFKLAEGLPSILRGKLEGLIQKLDYLHLDIKILDADKPTPSI